MSTVPLYKLTCQNCGQHMTALQLLVVKSSIPQTVEIDVCESCCFFWFDKHESIQLRGKAAARVLEIIHEKTRSLKYGQLNRNIKCPRCATYGYTTDLDVQYNTTKFGRFTQLGCKSCRGHYQSFLSFLAEKGYIRKLSWNDIQTLKIKSQYLFCSECGACLEGDDIQDQCPHCHSSLGLLDPERLVSAIADPCSPLPESSELSLEQTKCHSCGTSVTPTEDYTCPACKQLLLNSNIYENIKEIASSSAKIEKNKQKIIEEIKLENQWDDHETLDKRTKEVILKLILGLATMAIMLILGKCYK